MYFSVDGGISFSAGELDKIIEATGGRTVFRFGLGTSVYEPKGGGVSAKEQEKYERQKDAQHERRRAHFPLRV